MRPWIMVAGVNGALAIGLAAYGAHGVDAAAVPLMEKASQFQLIHAVALLVIDRLAEPKAWLVNIAGGVFTFGVALFSGSLYVKAMTGPLPFPMVTPTGGILLLLGWLVLAVSAFVRDKPVTV